MAECWTSARPPALAICCRGFACLSFSRRWFPNASFKLVDVLTHFASHILIPWRNFCLGGDLDTLVLMAILTPVPIPIFQMETWLVSPLVSMQNSRSDGACGGIVPSPRGFSPSQSLVRNNSAFKYSSKWFRNKNITVKTVPPPRAVWDESPKMSVRRRSLSTNRAT